MVFGWLKKTFLGDESPTAAPVVEKASAPAVVPSAKTSAKAKRSRSADEPEAKEPAKKVAKTKKGKVVHEDDWDTMMDKVFAYAKLSGSVDDIGEEEPKLAAWFKLQEKQLSSLGAEQATKIKSLYDMSNIVPPKPMARTHKKNPSFRTPKFDVMFERMLAFKEVYGHTRVPTTYEDGHLAKWARRQRLMHSQKERGLKDKMTPENIKKLENLGFAWKLPRGRPRKDGTPNKATKE
jgi:hypothetical protein